MIQPNNEFMVAGGATKTIYPANSLVYVHVTDNGNGTHAINGKIVQITESQTAEHGWVRTTQTLPSSTTNLLQEAHEIVKQALEAENPNVTFSIIKL